MKEELTTPYKINYSIGHDSPIPQIAEAPWFQKEHGIEAEDDIAAHLNTMFWIEENRKKGIKIVCVTLLKRAELSMSADKSEKWIVWLEIGRI